MAPLVFAPFTTEALEINKQLFMFVCVAVAGVCLLGSMVAARVWRLRGSWWLNLPPLLLLVITVAASLFSVVGVESWLGYGGQEYVSLVTLAAGVGLFYILVNGSDALLARQSITALLFGTGLSGLVTVLSILGIHLIPFDFTHISGFSTVGNINALIAWMIPVSLIGIGSMLTESDAEDGVIPGGAMGWLVRGLVVFVTVTLLFLLVAIDFWALWAAFMLGLSALVAMSFLQPSQFSNSRRLLVPVLLFGVAVVFLFAKTPFKVKLPVVVSPDMGTSWDIAAQTLQEGPVRMLLGSGPGSFDLSYAKYRPVEVNNTIFWNTRFDRAQAHAVTLLATTGALGLIAWVALLAVLVWSGLSRLARDKQQVGWKMSYAVLSGWLALCLLLFFTPSNMALTILFWTLSGLLAAEAATVVREQGFAASPRVALVLTGGLAFGVVALMLISFSLISHERGDIAFAKAARLDASGAAPQELIDQMLKATGRESSNSVYQRNLATAYLAQAAVMVQASSQDQDLSDEEQQALLGMLDLAVKAAAEAASLGGSDAANWATNGLIYRELMPFIPNAQNYAASMYVKALELEPNNPAYQTDLARVYLAVADRAQALQDVKDIDAETKATAVANEIEDLRLAAESLELAIRLKPDYAPAHYYLAATYERQGDLEAAAKRLAALSKVQPNDVGLGFQLSVIYLKMEKQAEAEAELKRILVIYPDYSNAMWYLAAIKAGAGEAEEALVLLRKVLALNPNSDAVKQSIENLTNGDVTSGVPEPIDAPSSVVTDPVVTP